MLTNRAPPDRAVSRIVVLFCRARTVSARVRASRLAASAALIFAASLIGLSSLLTAASSSPGEEDGEAFARVTPAATLEWAGYSRLMVKVRVDADLCVGHGRCYVLAPDVFGTDEFGHCIVLEEQVSDALAADARVGADNCPEQAITIE